MWFHKAKESDEKYPFAGEERAVDGHQAMLTVEAATADALAVHAASAGEVAELHARLRQLNEDAFSERVHVSESAMPSDVVAATLGQALSGLRASAVGGAGGEVVESLRACAGKRVPFLYHLTCRGQTRTGGALHGSHDDYHAVADSGCFQFFAKDVQAVIDLALIARRVTEQSLTPGICAQDFYTTSHSLQNASLPPQGFAHRYLGRSGDAIEPPTESQRILFGESRRRVPVLLDSDHPAGIGATQDRESYFKAVAAGRVFFSDHLATIIDDAMREYGELTGRRYDRLGAYRVDDADIVILAQGSVVGELRHVIDHMRDNEHVKVGLISVNVFRPFPGAELSHLLQGKKALTVLERTDAPLAEDLPLGKEVRAALDKSIENARFARSKQALPHPDYATCSSVEDRPAVFTGVYGVGGGLPTFGEMVAAVHNMRPSHSGRLFYCMGPGPERDLRKFPQLQMLQQRLAHRYNRLDDIWLRGSDVAPAGPAGGAVQLHTLSGEGALQAGNLLARTLADALGWRVRTFPEAGLDASLQPAVLTISHAPEDQPIGARPSAVNTVICSDDRLLERLPSTTGVKRGGALIVGSSHDARALTDRMSNRTAHWIRSNELRLFVVDEPQIADTVPTSPAFIDQLMIWSLLGAWLHVGAGLSDADINGVIDRVRPDLETAAVGGEMIDEIVGVIERGAETLQEQHLSGDERPIQMEAEPPWTVRDAQKDEETVFDPARFWHSVGYLYDKGQAEATLTDPFVATGIVPARSSAFRDLTPYRLSIPRWLADNCTGCGLCWAYCPESAMPPSLNDVTSILETAVDESEKTGDPIVQLRRVTAPLAKKAYQLLVKDEDHKYVTAGPLLRDAFAPLVKKMNLAGDDLDAVNNEFTAVCEVVEHYPIAKSDAFFADAEKAEKGSGRLLTIAVDPSSCTACGVCVEECPDDALSWMAQEDDAMDRMRRYGKLQKRLAPLSRSTLRGLISQGDPPTQVRRLLDPDAYWSLVGGDGSFPGNAAKTAVHLTTATIESVMAPRFDAHVEKLTQLIGDLEAKIQSDLHASTKISDFEAFGERLRQLGDEGVSVDSIASLVGEDEPGVDAGRLKRLTGLLHALKQQRRLYDEGASGAGRARMVMTIDSSAGALWSGTYPYNAHANPWVTHLPGDAAMMAIGIFDGMRRRLTEELAVCRSAELELEDRSDDAQAALASESAHELLQAHADLMPPVVVLGSKGVTDWHAVSQLLSHAFPIRIVIINSDGPPLAEGQDVSDLAAMALSSRKAFVLQSSIGDPGHLISGIVAGLASERPAVFHIYAPNPHVSGVAPERIAGHARLAYASRAFPLYSFDPDLGDGALRLDGNPEPARAWADQTLVTLESGEAAPMVVPVTVADWALGEARVRDTFELVPKEQMRDEMKPLGAYLELDAETRATLKPYIDVVDAQRQHLLAVVPDNVVRATERAAAKWMQLQGMAAGAPPVQPAVAETVAASGTGNGDADTRDLDARIFERVTARLLELSGYGRDPDFFKKSLKDFVTREVEHTEEEGSTEA